MTFDHTSGALPLRPQDLSLFRLPYRSGAGSRPPLLGLAPEAALRSLPSFALSSALVQISLRQLFRDGEKSLAEKVDLG